ncbi:hypothetical protein, partial [Neisseria shayeganii]
SPALSYQIGQYFKSNDLTNQADGGQRPGESSPAHLLAHSILGAVVAASGGHNALSGALSAGGAEAAAPVLSRWLYGKAAAELMGWIDGHHHNNNHFVGTDKFLRGLTGSIQGCAQGICIGRDRPLVGNDHGIGSTELGIGTRGGTVSIGYTFDPYDNQSVSDKFERGNQ